MRRFAWFFALLLVSTAAFGSGFQVTAQGARAMGMGLAYTAVADDASAIFYNPAGLAFQENELIVGTMVARNLEGSFTSSAGVTEEQQASDNLLPQLYYSRALGGARLGIGAYASFGLPMRWENPTTFSGRHSSTLANIRAVNLNPTLALHVTDNLAVGFGVDWTHSKVQLERFREMTFPVGPGVTITRDIARAKLQSDLADSSGWGWNAGLMWRDGPWRLGVAYRSSIDLDHEGTLTVTQVPTGIAAIDAAVRAGLPAGPLDASVPIELPSSLNLGLAYTIGGTTIAFDANRTDWSSFSRLRIDVPARPDLTESRVNDWEDTWAYRVGVETNCGPIVCRAGYYRDQTPQPLANVGPILPDADRQGYTVGIGLGPQNGRWSIDLANVYVRFAERTTTRPPSELAGTWETTGNEFVVNFHWR